MTIMTIDATRRAQNVSACSFDVFDTFLLRACTTPDGVFERVFQLSRIAEKFPNMSISFVQHRIQAEARARKLAQARNGSTEVRIADIYKYFPFRLFGLSRDALQALAQIEFEAELELCRVNPDMLEQYLDMKRGGFRTGFISDTYWSTDQLAQLLRSCSPGLTWDFLYASCDRGSSKSEALFAAYLTEQGIDAASSFHVGDNHNADIKGAQRHGIRPRYYPQASAALASKFQRETSIFELLCPHQPSRLDCGARTLRRAVTARSAEHSAAFNLGVTVLGPVMAAFDAFLEARRAALAREGARVAIGFLGRDGLLPYRVRQANHGDTGAYVEINRRVSLVGSADTLSELLSRVVKIDAATFVDIVKVQPPAVMKFFAQYPDGIASGRELADALSDLMDPREITDIAAGVRARLLAYLRAQISDFDDCTDLILVDLGYSASVQKSLRAHLRPRGHAHPPARRLSADVGRCLRRHRRRRHRGRPDLGSRGHAARQTHADTQRRLAGAALLFSRGISARLSRRRGVARGRSAPGRPAGAGDRGAIRHAGLRVTRPRARPALCAAA
ncbi:hypothetical protein [Bradyrhizobium sp. USDA 3364]